MGDTPLSNGWFLDYINGKAQDNLVEVRGIVGPEAQRKAKSSVTRKLAKVRDEHKELRVLTLQHLKDILKGKYDEKVFPPPTRAGFPPLALEAIQGFEHILKYHACKARAETHLLAFITDFTKFRQDINDKYLSGKYMRDDWEEHVASLSDEWTEKLGNKIDNLSDFIKPMSNKRPAERLESDFEEIRKRYAALVDVITKELQYSLFRASILKELRDSAVVIRELNHELIRTGLYFDLKQLLKDTRHKCFKLYKDKKASLFASGLKDAQRLYKLEGDDYLRFINDVKPATPGSTSKQDETLTNISNIDKRVKLLEQHLSPIAKKPSPRPQHASSPTVADVHQPTPHPTAIGLPSVPEASEEHANSEATQAADDAHLLAGAEGAGSAAVLDEQLDNLRENQMYPTDTHAEQALHAAFNAEFTEKESSPSKPLDVRQPDDAGDQQQLSKKPKEPKEVPKNIYVNSELLLDLENKGHKSGCRFCTYTYDYWFHEKAPQCLGQIHRFELCPSHIKTIVQKHGKNLDEVSKKSRVFYMYEYNNCKCNNCKNVARMVKEKTQTKKEKFARFSTLSKIQTFAKDAYKNLKRRISAEAAEAARKAAEEIKAVEDEANAQQNRQNQETKDKSAEKPESETAQKTPVRQPPPPPTGSRRMPDESLLDAYRTADGPSQFGERLNPDGSYLQSRQDGSRQRQNTRSGTGADPPPPDDNAEDGDDYWSGEEDTGGRTGAGADPPDDPSDHGSDDENNQPNRGRRQRRGGGDPDDSPGGSPGPGGTGDGGGRRGRSPRRGRDRRESSDTAAVIAQPQRTVLVQQTTLAAAGCSVFMGNPFQYIPWRSIVDSVFKNSQDDNAIRHSQLLKYLGGEALERVNDVQINAHNSVLTVLDILHKEYYRPEHLKDMRITNLLEHRVPGKTLSDVNQIVKCQKYIQCMKDVLECDTLYGVDVEWEFILTKIFCIKEVRDNHHKKWILRCQETAEKKHAGYYKDLPDYMREQNLKFPKDRFTDFMNLLQDILKVERYRSNYASDGGYNNPDFIKKAAKESILINQQRLERMTTQHSKQPQQGGFQPRNNNKRYPHSYNADAQPSQKKQSAQKPGVNAVSTPNAPKPPAGFGNPKVEAQKKCIFCNKTDHWGQFCRSFKPGDPKANERLYAAIRARKCLNCLGPDYHVAQQCPKQSQCNVDGCVRKHHKLLHGADFNRVRSMTESLQRHQTNIKKAQEAKAQDSGEVAKAGNQQNRQQPKNVRWKNSGQQRGRSGSRGRNNQQRNRSTSRGPNQQRQNQQGSGGARAAAEEPGKAAATTPTPTPSANE